MHVHTRSAVVDAGSRDDAYVVDGIGYLPLRSCDPAVVRWALVDADVFDSVAPYRWAIVGAGYVGRRDRQRTIYLQRSVLNLDDIHSPSLRFKNGDRLDCRKSNLLPSIAWAVRMMSNPDLRFDLLVHLISQTAAT